MSLHLPKTNEIFSKISALVSKKSSNQKKNIPVIEEFYFYFYTTFLFDFSLESRAEILEKILSFFWEIWRPRKDILKLTEL